MATLALPFGWGDYLSTIMRAAPNEREFGLRIIGLYTPAGYETPGQILRSYYYHAVHSPDAMRPSQTLLVSAQALLFGGEFWLWYLVKWAAEFAAVGLLWRILRRRGTPELAAWVVIAGAVFHPCSFHTLLFAADGWIALGALASIALLLDSEFSIASLSARRYATFLAVWFLTLGIKDSAIAFCLVLAVVLQALEWRRRTSWMRLAPCYAALAWWMYRLPIVARTRLEGHAAADYWSNAVQLIRFLAPESPFQILGPLLAAAMLWGAWRVWQRQDATERVLWLVCLGGGAAMLMVSARFQAAQRYDVPVVFLFAVPLGLTLGELPRRFFRPVLAAGLVMLPLANAGSLYAQTRLFQESFMEFSGILDEVEQKTAMGYTLTLSGLPDDIAAESQAIVAVFFRDFASRFYGTPVVPKVHTIRLDGIPKEPFVLMTAFTPEQLEAGAIAGLKPGDAESVEYVRRRHDGAIEKLTRFYREVNRWMGNGALPVFDYGVSPMDDHPRWFVVTVGKPPLQKRRLVEGAAGGLCRDSRARPLGNTGCTYTLGAGQAVRIPVGHLKGEYRVEVGGELTVERGAVSVGVTTTAGRDLWNTLIPAQAGWAPFPAVPPLSFSGDSEYFVFVFAPEGQSNTFSLRDSTTRIRALAEGIEPSRRYGAIGW
jgi:hypothetical protein